MKWLFSNWKEFFSIEMNLLKIITCRQKELQLKYFLDKAIISEFKSRTNPRASQTEYFSQQTHLLGKSDRGILYLKPRESLNSCLFHTKPWSTRGIAVSHELAPLSLHWLTDHSRSDGRVESILSTLDFTDAVFKAWCCLFSSSVEGGLEL